MSQKYGKLLYPDIKIHRQYFREMCKLIGIYVLYREPMSDKHYTTWAEMDANYKEPIKVGCIFDEHPSEKSMRKAGWMSELDDNSSIIHVDYDLPGLQAGALFIIPSGLDDGRGRIFRVVRMQNIAVYPASITCEIVPEYFSNMKESTKYVEKPNGGNLLRDETLGPTYILSDEELESLIKNEEE